MYGWSFDLDSPGAWSRLLRALEGHRYLAEVDHRLHWAVDVAVAGMAADGGSRARYASFAEAVARVPDDLERASRDPRVWRSATVDEVAVVLDLFWGPSRDAAAAALRAALDSADIPRPGHAPGATDPDEPPHPELLLLDWVLLPVDELDAERHRGALRALEAAEEEVHPSESVYLEGPIITEAELVGGPWEEPIFWATDPYAYAHYLFRGVAKAAKLAGPPVGLRDLD